MELTQDQADSFCSSLKSFHDSLPDDQQKVLEQVLEQASWPQEPPGEQQPGRPFFDRFLTLNPGRGGGKPTDFVTLKFPSDNDESDTPAY